MITAYIGLGSNLNDPSQQVKTAIDALKNLPCTRFIQQSSLYWSESLLPGQPRYCNAVAALDTLLSPESLLDELQAIENQQGRVRHEKWGPRTIDLDILLFGSEVIVTDRLIIPHPELSHRDFCLIPLKEIAPALILPSLNKL